MFRRTKIVCTLGPAVDSPERIAELIDAGMNVARINCSYGDWDMRRRWINWLRKKSDAAGANIGILLDLQGPKFRLGDTPKQGLQVVPGQVLEVGSDPAPPSFLFVNEGGAGLRIPQPEVLKALEPGRKLLIGDGDVAFRVTARAGDRIQLTCLSGGIVKPRAGITVVGVSFDVPALTEKDICDLKTGVELGVEFVAMSYVKSAADVALIARHVEEIDPTVQVIAKIEMRGAVREIVSIIRESDGIMVARGDMGLQLAIEEVPLVQKRIIALCHAAGKPVITATQMMESMVQNPRPTRAETTDVANAILDGTDAIMLSGETAIGAYPIETVRYMDRIARKTEKSAAFSKAVAAHTLERITEATEAVARAAVDIAHRVRAKAIISFSSTGFTARMVAKFRPRVPILCATYRKRTACQVALLWGVRPLLTDHFANTEDMISRGFDAALKQRLLRVGDLVAITAGFPVGRPGTTNLVTLMQVQRPEK